MRNASTGFVESDWTRRATGEFSEHHRTEPEVSLNSPTLSAQLSARRAQLQGFGYVRAHSVEHGNPYASLKAGQWWKTTEALAEVAEEGYPLMPAERDGGTRAYLKTYAGKQTALRMPSAKSVRAYAKYIGTTFDIPVESSTPDGAVTGHVRVTDNGNGTYSVSPVAMKDPAGAYVAESVSAVLEGRRASLALNEVSDILARRRERIASAGVRVTPVEHSSWITGMGYNAADRQMVVEMGNRVYGYHVSPEAFRSSITAASPGEAYNRLVKGEPRFEVNFHDECGRYYNVAAGHRCASQHHAPGDVRERNARLMRSMSAR